MGLHQWQPAVRAFLSLAHDDISILAYLTKTALIKQDLC